MQKKMSILLQKNFLKPKIIKEKMKNQQIKKAKNSRFNLSCMALLVVLSVVLVIGFMV